jgi:ribosomal-protein-alanine N-acetyltransferase
MMDLGRESPTAGQWSRRQYEGVFATGDRPGSERFALVAEADTKLPTEANAISSLHAFLVARRVDTEWELENIVVAERVRRQGLGRLMLKEFISHAWARKGSAIFLEVRESNQNARALYRSMGFEESGQRSDYYADPVENAVVYRLLLS